MTFALLNLFVQMLSHLSKIGSINFWTLRNNGLLVEANDILNYLSINLDIF